ncbi:MAG TPA: type II toxin-antitoxin system VapC family toxin [Gemmatimonadota bacterium]|nr:type II toxin-antitoxin system VapC family toxin [Gemmatimonadota bacterium]
MIIDSSAVLAILFGEPEAPAIERAMEIDPIRRISAGNLLESAIVAEARFGEVGGRELDLFLLKAGVEVVPVDARQVELARAAYRRWGKGRDRAGLNFGDCFAYALAAGTGEPLLFTGTDFGRTDVRTAEWD